MSVPPPKAEGLASRVARLWRGGAAETASPWLPAGAPYPRLTGLAPAHLGGTGSGLYACWHLGVRPRWLRVGGAADLALTIAGLQKRDEITRHDVHGGVFVAWAFVNVADIPGAARFLADTLKPALQDLAFPGEIAAADDGVTFPLPPGTQQAAPPRDPTS